MSVRSSFRMPQQVPADNKRKERRKPMSFAARVDLGGDVPLRKCVLSDISKSGVRLYIADAPNIPDEFTLVMDVCGKVQRACRTVWRSHTEIGAEFLDEEP